MTFAIIASSYYPRCALDAIDGAEIRVSKIAKMIGECDWGIHDLSRVEIDTAGVPRFNMPMELGLHLGARLFGSGRHRRKRALILEAQSHRYDAALSDISGQDIEVHANDPGLAIRRVRNWLSEHRASNEPPLPGAVAMLGDYAKFQADAGRSARLISSLIYREIPFTPTKNPRSLPQSSPAHRQPRDLNCPLRSW